MNLVTLLLKDMLSNISATLLSYTVTFNGHSFSLQNCNIYYLTSVISQIFKTTSMSLMVNI